MKSEDQTTSTEIPRDRYSVIVEVRPQSQQIINSFLAGIIFWSGVRSLSQDIIGKDAYIALVQETWISAAITVPVSLILLILAGHLMYQSLKIKS